MKVFLRNKSSIKDVNMVYFKSIIPLLIFGLYKYGIKLYLSGLIGFLGIFKPLMFNIIGVGIGLVVDKLYGKIRKGKKVDLFSSFYPFYGLLISCLCSINTNVFVFVIVAFGCLFLSKFFKFALVNVCALASLLITVIMKLFKGFTFLSIYEVQNDLSYNGLDYFIGKGVGGIDTTCIVLLIVSLIILNSVIIYKKNIPLYSIAVYICLCLVYSIICSGNVFEMILTNGVIFSFVYLAPDSMSSPCSDAGTKTYGILCAILAFVFYFIHPSVAAVCAILLASIFYKLIDKVYLNKR